jgi:hypothetical protein
MQKKPIEEPINDILGANIFMPTLSETGYAEFTAENIINAYENEAREILKAQGCPQTLAELWAKRDKVLPDLGNGRGISQVYSIFWALWFLERVCVDVQEDNANQAVCDMVAAVDWATRARLKPVMPKIEMGAAFTDRKDKAYEGKILRPKQAREAFAKFLVSKYPHLEPRPLAAKILDATRAIVFRHHGNDFRVYRAYKKGRFGKTVQCVRFESSTGNHFDFAMDTFVDTRANAFGNHVRMLV